MLITRTSAISGITRSQEINVLPDQLARWKEGTPIQFAMPNLTADEREFIMTGITAEEWDDAFGEPEEWDEELDSEEDR